VTQSTHQLLTIITESALESDLIKEIESLGAHGYTIVDARGKGNKGVRNGGWDANANIQIEIICSQGVADKISAHMQAKYYKDYAMVLFSHDVKVLRPEKF
jgi:hypothetical protein